MKPGTHLCCWTTCTIQRRKPSTGSGNSVTTRCPSMRSMCETLRRWSRFFAIAPKPAIPSRASFTSQPTRPWKKAWLTQPCTRPTTWVAWGHFCRWPVRLTSGMWCSPPAAPSTESLKSCPSTSRPRFKRPSLLTAGPSKPPSAFCETMLPPTRQTTPGRGSGGGGGGGAPGGR